MAKYYLELRIGTLNGTCRLCWNIIAQGEIHKQAICGLIHHNAVKSESHLLRRITFGFGLGIRKKHFRLLFRCQFSYLSIAHYSHISGCDWCAGENNLELSELVHTHISIWNKKRTGIGEWWNICSNTNDVEIEKCGWRAHGFDIAEQNCLRSNLAWRGSKIASKTHLISTNIPDNTSTARVGKWTFHALCLCANYFKGCIQHTAHQIYDPIRRSWHFVCRDLFSAATDPMKPIAFPVIPTHTCFNLAEV